MPVALYAESRSTGNTPFLIVCTFKSRGTLCDKLPDVAVTVTVALSERTELSAFSVRVPALRALGGVKVAVTPAGSPVAARLTLLWNPFLGFTPIATVALRSWVMERLVTELESEKSLSPSAAGGRTSYKGCAGLTVGSSSATDIAKMRILGLSGSLIVFVSGSKSTE